MDGAESTIIDENGVIGRVNIWFKAMMTGDASWNPNNAPVLTMLPPWM